MITLFGAHRRCVLLVLSCEVNARRRDHEFWSRVPIAQLVLYLATVDTYTAVWRIDNTAKRDGRKTEDTNRCESSEDAQRRTSAREGRARMYKGHRCDARELAAACASAVRLAWQTQPKEKDGVGNCSAAHEKKRSGSDAGGEDRGDL